MSFDSPMPDTPTDPLVDADPCVVVKAGIVPTTVMMAGAGSAIPATRKFWA